MAFRFLDGKDAMLQSFDPADPATWDTALGYVENRLHRWASDGAPAVVMVLGEAPPAFLVSGNTARISASVVVP